MITNARQKAACDTALQSLNMVFETIRAGLPEDLYAVDLMDAYRSLGEIIGEEVEDDLVNTIFSKFCMGK
jgi:tRNA modification GTPase